MVIRQGDRRMNIRLYKNRQQREGIFLLPVPLYSFSENQGLEKRVLEGMTIDRQPLKDHLEVVGHKDAFLYIEEIAKEDLPTNEFVIKQIHTLVLMNSAEDRGIYLRISVIISGAYTTPV